MTSLDWLGIAAAAAIGLAFYVIRQVDRYIAGTAAIVGSFAVGTAVAVRGGSWLDWSVMSAGLAMLAFGLLIVRVMLIRSVSLLLLGRLRGGATGDPFLEDIRGRLDDMRRFRLIRTGAGAVALTWFGQVIGTGVGAWYALLRIRP